MIDGKGGGETFEVDVGRDGWGPDGGVIIGTVDVDISVVVPPPTGGTVVICDVKLEDGVASGMVQDVTSVSVGMVVTGLVSFWRLK